MAEALTVPGVRIERRGWTPSSWQWAAVPAPLIAAGLAVLAAIFRWRGVDLPAQVYRVGLFHRAGLTVWDSQWYGGHWTLSYSVIFPPVAGLIGIPATEALSAAGAAWAFDRLVTSHFGRTARFGSVLFAVGTLAQVAVGQVPFLLGEAVALAACWAAARGRWRLAIPLGAAAALASPLAGAFLALATVVWMLAGRGHRRRLLALTAAAAAPVFIFGAWFPGDGVMPFPFWTFAKLIALFGCLAFVVPREEGALRAGVWAYLAAVVASFVLGSPMGGNIERLGECVGLPLAACVLWPRRRLLFAGALIPLALLQWMPAYGSFSTARRDPSAQLSYFKPLLNFLAGRNATNGRVEIVPTSLHWEAAYVAPHQALARGWERQLDTRDNPLFYDKDGFTGADYRAWLLDNGVRFVALPDAPLDYAAVDEARVVRAGVAGLDLAWRNANWTVYEVQGSTGIVSGAAELRSVEGGHIVIDATSSAAFLVRVRYTDRWTVTRDAGCVREGPGGWTEVKPAHGGPVHLDLHLVADTEDVC